MDKILRNIQHVLLENLPEFSYGPVGMFIYNLIVAGLLASLLAWIYKRFGRSLSNRSNFGRIFPLLAVTTMIVISFVKSSLALSLGLVGALSIIRFRSAIKEPEELAYLFLCIAVGIGCGAGFSTITLIAMPFILGMIIILRGKKSLLGDQIYLNLSGKSNDEDFTMKVQAILKAHASEFRLKRSEWNGETFEMSFQLIFNDAAKLDAARLELQALAPEMMFSYLDASRDY